MASFAISKKIRFQASNGEPSLALLKAKDSHQLPSSFLKLKIRSGQKFVTEDPTSSQVASMDITNRLYTKKKEDGSVI